MGNENQRGFTIIEVTLFLAISAVLAVLLLSGWTLMINTQRYKDSIKSTQSFIQQQYNLVYNVENGRGSDLGCSSGEVVDNATTTEPRGQTKCVLLGRYIELSEGSVLTVSAITGREVNTDTAENDTDSIRAHTPSKVVQNIGLTDDKLTIPWGATAVGASDGAGPVNLAIAIIRSPVSGQVHTYVRPVSSVTPPSVISMVDTDNENDDTTICLDAGAPLTGGRMGVQLKKFASSQSFVETVVDGTGVC